MNPPPTSPGPGYELGDTLSPTLLQLNVVGAYNAFEAARAAGCKRIVFASSIGAVDGYRDEGLIHTAWDAPVWPTTAYGATKCFGEALGRVYASTHGLSCVAVRLCNPGFAQDQGRVADPNVPGEAEAIAEQMEGVPDSGWGEMAAAAQSGMSPRDCAALFGCCVSATDAMLRDGQPQDTPPNFVRACRPCVPPARITAVRLRAQAIVNGISQHVRGWLDPEVARRVVGFVARDGTAFPRL